MSRLMKVKFLTAKKESYKCGKGKYYTEPVALDRKLVILVRIHGFQCIWMEMCAHVCLYSLALSTERS